MVPTLLTHFPLISAPSPESAATVTFEISTHNEWKDAILFPILLVTDVHWEMMTCNQRIKVDASSHAFSSSSWASWSWLDWHANNALLLDEEPTTSSVLYYEQMGDSCVIYIEQRSASSTTGLAHESRFPKNTIPTAWCRKSISHLHFTKIKIIKTINLL